MGITRIGVQPVIGSTGPAPGQQTYVVGEVNGETETLSVAVGCVNDLSAGGNLNVVHWQGAGDNYRIYKAQEGVLGLIGESDGAVFLDTNLQPDLTQPPPNAG
ncbi:hypothetical protein [Sphingomonas sp. URHD0057]|uniref:hypothetical protein n=1 Tax=Sphingomonas sp. URHD0057 TaxID=1380389 RepID=UPI00048DEC13|nr:hypothetical protein [Sphingomonas sp. URHD0057]